MAYIGQNLDRFSNVEKLDAITPATATGAGPYNLTKGGVAFTPSSADTMVISINGVVQYGNFTVSSSTVTFSAALADADVCDFIYHMGTGLLSTPVDNSVSTAKIVDRIKSLYPEVGIISFPRLIGNNIFEYCSWVKPDCVSFSEDVRVIKLG